MQQHYCRPTPNELSETVITEDCKQETGLDEDIIKNAQSLDHVLDEVSAHVVDMQILRSSVGVFLLKGNELIYDITWHLCRVTLDWKR